MSHETPFAARDSEPTPPPQDRAESPQPQDADLGGGTPPPPPTQAADLGGEPQNAPTQTSTTQRDVKDLKNQVQFFSAGEKPQGTIEVGGGFSCGELSMRRLLTMAAVAPEGSTDPVDVAMKHALKYQFKHGAPNTTVPADQVDPARERKYSLARISGFKTTKYGEEKTMVIARGDLESIINVAEPKHEIRSVVRRNAQAAGARGYRCLGIASATVGENGELSPFQLEGFINVRPTGTGLVGEDLTPTSDDWVRLKVWGAGLRFLHWLNVLLIVTLCATGYYIMDPFFGDSFFRGVEPGWLMGWIRFIHFTAGFCWIAVGAVRVVIAFVSKDRYMRWSIFWPFKTKQDWRNLWLVIKHYLFLEKEGPLYVAHNPLQQMAYTGIYALGAVQMLVGLSLYALPHKEESPIWAFITLPNDWIGIPNMRLVHAIIMYLFIVFVIGHIYLAFRADSMERHGGVSSMINGGVYLRRGSRPVDAPEL